MTKMEIESLYDTWQATWNDPTNRAKLLAARQEAREAFARSRGWTIAQPFTLGQLKRGSMHRRQEEHFEQNAVLDHPEHFRSGFRPVAILVHTYAPWSAVQDFAARNQLSAERLPFSWYSPRGCNAVLLTPIGGSLQQIKSTQIEVGSTARTD
jgi:hypothetical protein